MKIHFRNTVFTLALLFGSTTYAAEVVPAVENMEVRLQSRSEDYTAWGGYSSGKMKISKGEVKGEIRFDIDFGESKSRWASPGFAFRYAKEKISGTIGMEFEIKINGNASDVKWPLIYFYGTGKPVTEQFAPPSDKWEVRKIVFKRLMNPSTVQSFSISLTSNAPTLSFSIRNIKFYYPKQGM